MIFIPGEFIMDYLFPVLILLSFVIGIFEGTLSDLSTALIEGACEAVTLFLTLAGTMSFWNGIMAVAQKAGIISLLNSLLNPFLTLLFGKGKLTKETGEMVSFNLSANFLGLGNAATPSGLKAMKLLHHSASPREETIFVILNSCSLQLIPTSVAAIRLSAGSLSPFDITMPILCSSLISVAVSLLTAKIIFYFKRRNQ